MTGQEDILADLARFDGEFNPQIRPANLDALPDGDFEFEIRAADFDKTKMGDRILAWTLTVLGGPSAGVVVNHTYWFRSQVSVDILGSDLSALGFDVQNWTAANKRLFSGELVIAVPKLRGTRFKAKKVASQGQNGKTYHNLRNITKIPHDGKPAPAAPLVPEGAPAPSGETIPF